MKPDQFPGLNRQRERLKDAEAVTQYVKKEYPRLDPRDFTDIFPAEEIERDIADANHLEHQFKDREVIADSEQISKALEGIVIDQTRRSAWLGLTTEIVRTSAHDDIRNGVDAVAEFTNEEIFERMALAIDATRAADQTIITKKIERNLRKILNEKPETRVKYFASLADDFRGSLDGIVPVVIGLDTQHCKELIDLLSELIRLQENKNRTPALQEKFLERRTAIENHPAQIVFLKQIEVQLDFYEEVFSKRTLTKDQQLLLDRVSTLKALIQEIVKDKSRNQNIRITDDYEQDSVLRNIREVTYRLRIQP
ncbi:MAG: hypothetical protein COU11_02215 [Candidatus Harrisonbacteria bacterium CG10_big_fil_rev_8_21_14_0_10_49_15]|uniref:Uncharacterized protein n=1 Tax=Candidatus Harrisonbacteria bacterium CG10_big_fil_rev_8_21_14_0_10_49_15 TaxID=1974587 RepID=A0A2H0UKT3_9BACT|nr:MAG: hypothetical protein COU11_02215 [Candidatus Harrisonbacteria bacterium CG10_big_fil_rev_8_21_14_0_10_49_15]